MTEVKFSKVLEPVLGHENAVQFVKIGQASFDLVITSSDGKSLYSLFQRPVLKGDKVVYPGVETTYTIENFDFTAEYLSPTTQYGNVQLVKDKIYYTPPLSGNVGFSFGGKDYPLTLATVLADKPSITIPTDETKDIGNTLLVVCSMFKPFVQTISHVSTTWEKSTTPDFTTGVTSYTETTSLLYKLFNGVDLNQNTVYYLRVKHNYSNGSSEWSDVISFITRPSFVPAFEVGKIMLTDKAVGDYTGSEVLYSGDGQTLIITAPNKTVNSVTACGAVYIYTKSPTTNTWVFESKLSGTVANAQFGYAVAISFNGSVLAIGTNLASAKGSVFVYGKSGTTWTAQTLSNPAGLATGNAFGSALAMNVDGTTLVIGAPNYSNGQTACGSAWVYTRSGTAWTNAKTLSATDKQANDHFGSAVAINLTGTIIAVAALDRDSKLFTGVNTGAIYTFEGTGANWNQRAILVCDTPSNTIFPLQLGYALSMNNVGDRIAASSIVSNGTTGNTNINTVIVFTGSGTTWSKMAVLSKNNGAVNEQFGSSLSFDGLGMTLAIGAKFPTSDGYVSVMSNTSGNTWEQKSLVKGSDLPAGSLAQFGASVSLTNDNSELAVGAPKASLTVSGVTTTNTGFVYIYR